VAGTLSGHDCKAYSILSVGAERTGRFANQPHCKNKRAAGTGLKVPAARFDVEIASWL
jgi:hypothetical protein